MNEATKQAALLAALQAAPRESCGLVVETSEGERYWPCRNVSPIESDFTVSKFDYVAATKAGRIVGVVHSHPNGFPLPTQADLTKCEESGLGWYKQKRCPALPLNAPVLRLPKHGSRLHVVKCQASGQRASLCC